MEFRTDTYKCYRAVWGVIGFIISSLLFSVYFQNQLSNKFFLEKAIWFIILAIALVLSLIVTHKWGGIDLRDDLLIINKIYTKIKIKVAIIISLDYIVYNLYHYVFIQYQNEEKLLGQYFRVEDFNTKTISDLNTALKAEKPNMLINFDESSKKYLEKNKNLHLKTPDTKLSWLLLGAKFFMIFAIINLFLLYILAPR